MIILHLCADTGSDSTPWLDAGYEVVKVGAKIGVENYTPPNPTEVYGIIANPVCTEFSRAPTGGKPRNIAKGLHLVRECQRIISLCPNLGFWIIENPATGALRQYLGKPKLTYHPWHYGSPWTKHTALWGKFNSPPKLYTRWQDVPNKIPQLYTKSNKPAMAAMHKSHKTHKTHIREFDRFTKVNSDMEFRSLCSQHFAKAFYEANKPALEF